MNSFSYNADAAFMTWLILSSLISVLVSMGITALIMVSNWHIFKKLGMPGWKGIIPYYSDYMLFQTLWKTKPFWTLVIASGVYIAGSVLMTILLPLMLFVNRNAANTEQMTAMLVIFFVVFGLLTLAFIILALVINFMLHVRMARAFGKSVGFAVGLTFLSFVFYPILAFGKAQRQSGTALQN